VPCPPPEIGAKKVQEISESRFRTTYIISDVALERAGVDLHNGGHATAISAGVDPGGHATAINNSALEVACPPPGHGEISGNF
jgi:hypothetical protein